MGYYSQRRYSSRGPDPWPQGPHFQAFNQRRGRARPSVHWPQDENSPHYFSREYERSLPHRSWSPGPGYRGSESNPPPNLRHFSTAERRPKNNFQYSFYKDTNMDGIWPHAADGNMMYPDSAEESQSDSAESLNDRGRTYSAKNHNARTKQTPPDTLPPVDQRCETIRSGSSATSPSVSQPKSGQQSSTFSSFSTFAFPSVSNSDSSTPSRRSSSSPPISPHTNEPAKENGDIYSKERHRLRHERRLNKHFRRRLMKDFKELRLRERLVRERETEIGIRAREDRKGQNEYMENTDMEGQYMSDGWWSIPGILD